MRHPVSESFLDSVAAAISPRSGQIDVETLVEAALGFATAGHPVPALFRAVAEQAAPQLHELGGLATRFPPHSHTPQSPHLILAGGRS